MSDSPVILPILRKRGLKRNAMRPGHDHPRQVRFGLIARNEKMCGMHQRAALMLLGDSDWVADHVSEEHSTGYGFRGQLLQEILQIGDDLGNESRLWLIAERLAMDWISMAALVDETDAGDPDFAVFELGESTDRNSVDSPLAVARIKMGLFRRIVEDPEATQCWMDCGLSAAVSTLGNGVDVLEWGKHEQFRRFFRPGFPNCEEIAVVPGIHYPVLDPATHEAICSLNLDLAERMGSRVLPYTGNKNRGWFVDDAERWMHWFGRIDACKVLEIGATDGIGTIAMLDLLFPHPESEVHAVCLPGESGCQDSGGDPDHFSANAAAGGHTRQIQLYTGQPVEILAWMIAEEGYWESFDFIHFKPVPDQIETMTAAGQAWSLLKPGGVILFDSETKRIGTTHPMRSTMESFAGIVGNLADPLLSGEVIALRKRRPLVPGGESTTHQEETIK